MSMSVSGVQPQVPQQVHQQDISTQKNSQTSQIAKTNQAPQTNSEDIPAPLRGGTPRTGALFSRVLTGILTCGLSELVIAGARGLTNSITKAFGNPGDVQKVKQQTTPPAEPKTDKLNHELANQIRTNTMPEKKKAAISEGIDELKPQFGKSVQLDEPIKNNIIKSVQDSKKEVTASALKNIVKTIAIPQLVNKAIDGHIQQLCKGLGIKDIKSEDIYGKRNFGDSFTNLLSGCKSDKDVEVLFNKFKPELEEKVRQIKTNKEAMTKFINEACKKYSKGFGISLDTLKKTGRFEALQYHANKTLSIQNRYNSTDVGVKAQEVLNKHVDDQLNIYKGIDKLDVSDGLKSTWKDEWLSNKPVKSPGNFSAAVSCAKEVSSESVISALKEIDTVDDSHMLGVFKSLTLRVMNTINNHVELKDKPEVHDKIVTQAMQAMLDQTPELAELINNNSERIQGLVGSLSNELNGEASDAKAQDSLNWKTFLAMETLLSSTKEQIKTNLIDNLTNHDSLSFLQQEAIHNAIADLREQYKDFPAGATLQELSLTEEGESCLNVLQTKIQYLDHMPSPDELKNLVKVSIANLSSEAKKANQEAMAKMLEEAYTKYSKDSGKYVATLTKALDPNAGISDSDMLTFFKSLTNEVMKTINKDYKEVPEMHMDILESAMQAIRDFNPESMELINDNSERIQDLMLRYETIDDTDKDLDNLTLHTNLYTIPTLLSPVTEQPKTKLIENLTNHNKLSPAQQVAIRDAITELRNELGQNRLPEGATLQDISKANYVSALKTKIEEFNGIPNPDELKELLKSVISDIVTKEDEYFGF